MGVSAKRKANRDKPSWASPFKAAFDKYFASPKSEQPTSSYLRRKKSTTDHLDSAGDYQKKLAKPGKQNMSNYKATQAKRKHQ